VNTEDEVSQYLLRTYGPRLTTADLAAVLKLAQTTIWNTAASGHIKVPTYVDNGKRYADYRDVAAYLNQQRSSASKD
jgi:hypothetical protein